MLNLRCKVTNFFLYTYAFSAIFLLFAHSATRVCKKCIDKSRETSVSSVPYCIHLYINSLQPEQTGADVTGAKKGHTRVCPTSS